MSTIRSKAYPSIDLEAAVKRATTIRENLGKGYYNREAMAKGMGYKSLSGVAVRAIAALAHYGLLDRKKDMYSLSDLAMRIIMPISEADQKEAILSALREPELYRELLSAYAGDQLPSALGNILAHSYGINPNASGRAADAFIASLNYAGVLNAGKIEVPSAQSEAEEANIAALQVVPDVPGASDETSTRSTPSMTSAVTSKLPSGIQIGFPAEFDYALMMGEFREEIKALEIKAKQVKALNGET